MKTGFVVAFVALFLSASASGQTAEHMTVKTDVEIPVQIILPDKIEGKVPAVLLLHGSGGISKKHFAFYTKQFAKMGVATIIIDTFTPRHIRSTVTNQNTVRAATMARDAIAVLQHLHDSPHIDVNKVILMGFSKGGGATFLATLARNSKPSDQQFAMYVAMYPSCTDHWFDPKPVKQPIRILIGEKDAYNNPADCVDTSEWLNKNGANSTVNTMPAAEHDWDRLDLSHWHNATGENYFHCKFTETAPRIWIENRSKLTVANEHGQIAESRKKALHGCLTYGVGGGYNAAAAAKSLKLIMGYVEYVKSGRKE